MKIHELLARRGVTVPRLNQAFVEYAQARGFVIDPARVRRPRTSHAWNGRCRSCVARSSQARTSSTWPTLSGASRSGAGRAGLRVHGTTQAQPAEVCVTEERCRLLPAPVEAYDPADLRDAEGVPRPPRRGRPLALLGAGQPDRPTRRSPRRQGVGADLPPRSAGEGPSPPGPRPAFDRPPTTCRRRRPPTRCGIWTDSAGWPRATVPPSAPTRPRSWRFRCHGRGCGRSTRSWGS